MPELGLCCQLSWRSVGVHRKNVCGCHFNCLSLCVCASGRVYECVRALVIFINTASFLPLPLPRWLRTILVYGPRYLPPQLRRRLQHRQLLLLLRLGVCHKARQEGAASLPPGNHWAAWPGRAATTIIMRRRTNRRRNTLADSNNNGNNNNSNNEMLKRPAVGPVWMLCGVGGRRSDWGQQKSRCFLARAATTVSIKDAWACVCVCVCVCVDCLWNRSAAHNLQLFKAKRNVQRG